EPGLSGNGERGRFKILCGLFCPGEVLAGGRGGAEDREGEEVPRLTIVWVLAINLLHARLERLRARGMVELVGVAVVGAHGVDVVALPLRLRVGRSGLRRRLASFLELRGSGLRSGVARRPYRMEARHRDAPVRHGARRIGLRDLEECPLRRVVPERVEQRDAALELRAHRGTA